jgi:uncharacterized membrane protein YkvA (DUF1232 family)
VTTTRTKRVLSSAARARRRKVQSEPIAARDATGPRTGAKRTLVGTMREIPNFLRLLYGLITDARVSNVDKLLVAGAIAYVLMPMDLVPDFIPFIGEVDDVFVIVMALQRLISNAGRAVVADHWMGEPGELSSLNLERVLAACAFFLPRRVRRRLRTIGRDI